MKPQKDTESKTYFINFLKNKGFTDITDSLEEKNGEYAAYDLTATWCGKKFDFELKKRNISHFKYGDNFCEQHKVDVMDKRVADGITSGGYIITMFNDNYMAINEFREPHVMTQTIGPASTEYIEEYQPEKQKVTKNYIHYAITDEKLWWMPSMTRATDMPF